MSAPALAEDTALQEPDILVLGSPLVDGETLSVDPMLPGSFVPDSAGLMRRVPGGNVANNGPLAGQVQYRGLFGPRINTMVDGQMIVPGGPNFMDPPLHYAPKATLERLDVTRGISPVSAGPGFGGTVNAVFKTSRFTNNDAFSLGGDVTVFGSTVNDGFGGGGLVSYANRRHRFHVLGTYEEGEDVRFPDGRVRGTSFDRWLAGVGYGFRQGNHEVAFDYRHHETGPSGNPAFPLDTQLFDSEFVSGRYLGRFGQTVLETRVSFSDIDHRMDNNSVRPRPAGVPLIETPAEGRSWNYRVAVTTPLLGGDLQLGSDGLFTSNDSTVTRPEVPGFEIGNFNDAVSRRFGGFVEWTGGIARRLDLEAGVRVDHVATDAGPAFAGSSPPVPPPVQGLVAAFNGQDRSRTDVNVDAVLGLTYDASTWLAPRAQDRLSLQVTLARKTRSPLYVERYAFLPIEVTAGLADGNNTIGDVDLDPEVLHGVDAGFDWTGRGHYLSVRGFYNRIDDFIQSLPFDDTPTTLEDGVDPNTALTSPLTPAGGPAFFAQFDGPGGVAPSGAVEIVSLVNGDATPLRFSNVDARLLGVDAAFGATVLPEVPHLGGLLRFDGIVTYVRGTRRDVDEDLYRITPPRSVLAMTYERARWSVSVEGVLVADQDRVSRVNGELETEGYGLLNLYGEWRVMPGLQIAAGVENVFDTLYRDHLAGYNRTPLSDVPLFRDNAFDDLNPDARIPGNGVGAFVQLNLTF